MVWVPFMGLAGGPSCQCVHPGFGKWSGWLNLPVGMARLQHLSTITPAITPWSIHRHRQSRTSHILVDGLLSMFTPPGRPTNSIWMPFALPQRRALSPLCETSPSIVDDGSNSLQKSLPVCSPNGHSSLVPPAFSHFWGQANSLYSPFACFCQAKDSKDAHRTYTTNQTPAAHRAFSHSIGLFFWTLDTCLIPWDHSVRPATPATWRAL